MRNPPAAFFAAAVGLSTPDTQASGSGPNPSSCALTGKRLVSQQQTLLRFTTHADPPSPSAIAALTSGMARVFISQPPYRFGVHIFMKPAFFAAWIVSSSTRRLASPAAAFLRSNGAISRALSTNSCAVGGAKVCTLAVLDIRSLLPTGLRIRSLPRHFLRPPLRRYRI